MVGLVGRSLHVQGAAKKSSLPKFFAVFSATVWSFVEFFYKFIYWYIIISVPSDIWFCWKTEKLWTF